MYPNHPAYLIHPAALRSSPTSMKTNPTAPSWRKLAQPASPRVPLQVPAASFSIYLISPNYLRLISPSSSPLRQGQRGRKEGRKDQLWLAGVHQDRHGGYRAASRTLPSIALSLIGAITAAKRIQWIHRASSDRLVLALAGASHWRAEIGIGIGPIAIAILWQTTIRIVVAALQTPSSSAAVVGRGPYAASLVGRPLRP